MTARGVYVHVPFCVRKCYYCDFNSYSLDRSAVDAYLLALDREIRLYEQMLSTEAGLVFDTLFIGGGTPTCLSSKDLAGLVRRLLSAFPFKKRAEVTCEANPGSSNSEKFARMREAGVNRLSMGFRASTTRCSMRLGTPHTAEDVVESFEEARQGGIRKHQSGPDVRLARPDQDQWEQTVQGVLELGPDHLSCYSLIIEEETPFGDAYARGKLSLPGEDAEYEMFAWAIDALTAHGYEHYEISNFALQGYRSEHNQIYWRSGRWLGLGPGAHGFWERRRYANLRPLSEYNQSLAEGRLPLESTHVVSEDEEMDDMMIFGLRLLEGVSPGRFQERLGVSLFDVYEVQLQRLVELGLLEATPERVRLSPRGLYLANQVFAEFLRWVAAAPPRLNLRLGPADRRPVCSRLQVPQSGLDKQIRLGCRLDNTLGGWYFYGGWLALPIDEC